MKKIAIIGAILLTLLTLLNCCHKVNRLDPVSSQIQDETTNVGDISGSNNNNIDISGVRQ